MPESKDVRVIEVRDAMKRMKSCKSPGMARINVENGELRVGKVGDKASKSLHEREEST